MSRRSTKRRAPVVRTAFLDKMLASRESRVDQAIWNLQHGKPLDQAARKLVIETLIARPQKLVRDLPPSAQLAHTADFFARLSGISVLRAAKFVRATFPHLLRGGHEPSAESIRRSVTRLRARARGK